MSNEFWNNVLFRSIGVFDIKGRKLVWRIPIETYNKNNIGEPQRWWRDAMPPMSLWRKHWMGIFIQTLADSAHSRNCEALVAL